MLKVQPSPTPIVNTGGPHVITRYDEKPLRASNLSLYPGSTVPKYGTVWAQKKLGAAYVARTYPNMN